MRTHWRHSSVFKWALALLWIAAGSAALSQETRGRSPDRAEAVRDVSWVGKHRQQTRLLGKEVDLCMVGDSLTEFWLHTGKPVWQLEFHDLKSVNLGIAGDRTEHILYRITRCDFSRAKPAVIVLLAGTNNLGADPPDSAKATAKGIRKIVEVLATKCPTSKIVLVSVLPSGLKPGSPLRRRIDETNKLIAPLAEKPQVEFLDVHDVFVDEDGRWKRGLTLDGTHLSLHGYDLFARRLGPVVRKVLGERPKSTREK